jgi:hypothetical protein
MLRLKEFLAGSFPLRIPQRGWGSHDKRDAKMLAPFIDVELDFIRAWLINLVRETDKSSLVRAHVLRSEALPSN